MAEYSIKDLEKVSGIKAHTIRIWEKRYGVIKPLRSETNIRKYTDADLKRIINISILNQNGLKISKIALLSDEELHQMVLDLYADTTNYNTQIEALVAATLELDEGKFYNGLNKAIEELGFEPAVENILFPFLDRIGILWQTGTIKPAQEHFISNLIRQKMIAANDAFIGKATKTTQITFFLPENEHHEISLLYYNLIARRQGFKVVYLGVSVPFADLVAVNQIQKADAFFTVMIAPDDEENVEAQLEKYSATFSDTPIFITGLQVRNKDKRWTDNISVIAKAADFKAALNSMK